MLVADSATPQIFDMTRVIAPSKSKAGQRHPDHPNLSMNKKAIRNRTRRRGKITTKEFEELYRPIEEWDEEELARGRPRAKDGTFRGTSPKWLTREVHETAMARFKEIVQGRLREEGITALSVIHSILADETLDERGKPIVPASTKLDASKWLIEQVVGKPKQTTETDISVKLQAVLAHAMVGGDAAPQQLEHAVWEIESTEDDDD